MSKKIILLVTLLFLLGSCVSAPAKPILPARPSTAAQDRDTLQIGFQDGDTATRFSKNLKLPATGDLGSTIEWVSNDPTILSSEGVVNPSLIRDKTLQLTALIHSEGDERRKVFDLVIPRKEVKLPYPQISTPITLDGDLKEWKPGDRIPSSTSGVNYYLNWDEKNLYLGVEGPFIDIHGPQAKDTWVVAYMGFEGEEPVSSDQGEFFRSQTYTLPFKASYFLKWRVSDSYIQSGLPRLDRVRNRILWGFGLSPTSSDFNPLGLTMQSVAVGINSMEMAIPLERMGRPVRFKMIAFVIQESEGAEKTYGILPLSGGKDNSSTGVPMAFTTGIVLDLTSKLTPGDQVKMSVGQRTPTPPPRP